MLCSSFGRFDWSHLFEGQLASQFEAHHHHTSNPEEQDVMARLQQGAGVEHIEVLSLNELIMEMNKLTEATKQHCLNVRFSTEL